MTPESLTNFNIEPNPESEGSENPLAFFVRHGKPRAYGKKESHLSKTGRKDVSRIKSKLRSELAALPSRKLKIRIFYGPHIRTTETATLICNGLEDELGEVLEGKDLSVDEPVEEPLLEPGWTIDALLVSGVSRKKAFSEWFLNYEEYDAESPEDIQRKNKKLLNRTAEHQAAFPDGTKLVDIFVTHEVNLGSILYCEGYENEISPEYGELIKAQINREDENLVFEFSYRGRNIHSSSNTFSERELQRYWEYRVDPEKTEILQDVIDIDGEKVFPFVLERLLERGGRLFFIGSPNSGKSTILGQSIEALTEMFPAEVQEKIKTETYDGVLTAAQMQMGSRETWTIEKWLRFNKEFLIKSFKTADNHFLVAEMPAVGPRIERDRGVTTFYELSKDPSNIFVYIIGHPKVVRAGYSARTFVNELTDDQVHRLPSLLKEKYGIFFDGFEDTEHDGLLIKEFYLRSAPNYQSDIIRTEVRNEVIDWMRQYPQRSEDLIAKICLPDSFSDLRPYDTTNLVSEAAMMNDRFDRLKLGQDRGFIAFNPYFEGYRHMYIKKP